MPIFVRRSDRIYKAANRRTGPWEASAEGGKKGDDGDDDNGERLLTKIEVVVMTGIVRDEALRGDALAGALASSEKKTERERISVRERKSVRERTHGEPTRAENERRDTWKRIGKRAKDDNLGAERSCRLSDSGSQNFDRSEEIGICFRSWRKRVLNDCKSDSCESNKFLRESLRHLTRYAEFNVLTHPNITALSKIYIYCHY